MLRSEPIKRHVPHGRDDRRPALADRATLSRVQDGRQGGQKAAVQVEMHAGTAPRQTESPYHLELNGLTVGEVKVINTINAFRKALLEGRNA